MPATPGARRDLERRLEPERRLDQAVEPHGSSRAAAGRGRAATSSGPSTFGTWTPSRRRASATASRSALGEPGARGALTRTCTGLPRGRSSSAGRFARASSFAAGATAVLEVDDHRVRRGRDRLLDAVGPVGRGRRARSSGGTLTRRPRSRSARRARRRRRRARRAPRRCRRPCAPPAWRISPGVSERRLITFGISQRRRAPGRRPSAIAPSAASCGSASDVARVVDRRDRGLGLLERAPAPRRAGRSRDPRCDRAVDLVDVRGAARAGREPRLVDEVGAGRRGAGRARRSLVALAETATQRAVGGAVDVARRVVARAVAGARLQLAEQVVRGELRAEQRHQRLDRARCRRPARGRSCSRARSATMIAKAVASAGDAVGERERRQQRRPVGLAVQRREAAHRLGERAEARPARRTARSGRSRSRARARAAG